MWRHAWYVSSKWQTMYKSAAPKITNKRNRKGHDEPDLIDLTNSNHFEQDETTRPEVGGKANAAAELR